MARRRAHPRPLCTVEQRQALLELQRARCAICNRDDAKLFTDHSYRTGRTRGLLCRTCNTGLGQFQDSVKRLRAALHYLLTPPARFLEA
jgi:hypothetical protein